MQTKTMKVSKRWLRQNWETGKVVKILGYWDFWHVVVKVKVEPCES